ncbi:Alcohol dehydrogenase zinc-binding domain protein [Beutenbergia cavernae DSM 12333]|uniref:Alcohol dehydrogenase zinc-binding domain protein n=2 Tax=Beutenbergia TaxID=84756 RepID=C5BV97_BEUC1|nr:Alcohol dehydrogenase zinc-binding domain protein [Beutenbergia cavernae DSM 12333]
MTTTAPAVHRPAIPALTTTYRAHLGAGIDGLTARTEPTPEPGPREVLVRVRAVSLGFRELMILRGAYPLPVKDDLIPVSDGAGEVVAVGDDVGRVAVGDRVTAAIFPRWLDGPFTRDVADQLGGSLDGMLTEYALLPAGALLPVPAGLSFEQAACLPCAGVTAWNALTGGRGLRAGETVVTVGSGGVSLLAARLAEAAGASVIAVAGSAAKAARLRELGAVETIDRSAEPAWGERVRALTGGRGADHVVAVAGIGEQELSAVAIEGEIAFVGTLSDVGDAPAIDARRLFASGAVVRTLAVGSRAQFAAMNRLIEARAIEPVVEAVFAFVDAIAAYRHYETEQPFGKVVIALG